VRHEEGATTRRTAGPVSPGKVGVAIGNLGAGWDQHDHRPLHLRGGLHPHRLHHRAGPHEKLHTEAFQAVDIAEIAKPVAKKRTAVKETAQIPQVVPRGLPDRREGRPARCSSTCR